MAEELFALEREIPGDLSFTLPRAESASEGNIHSFTSQNSQHAPGSTVKINVPQLGYLTQGSYFTVSVQSDTADTVLDSVFSVFDRMTVSINGVEVLKEDRYGVAETNLLQDMPGGLLSRKQIQAADGAAVADRFLTDFPSGWLVGMGEALGVNAVLAADTPQEFLMPIRLGHLLNPTRAKLPLKHMSAPMVIELTVAASGQALNAAGAVLQVGTVTFHGNIADVAPELDREIEAMMIAGDTDSSQMLPILYDGVSVDSTTSPGAAGTQNLVFNAAASSARWIKFLVQDSAKFVDVGEAGSSSTSILNTITEAELRVQGVSFPANGVIRCTGNAPQAYAAYLDLLRHTQPMYSGSGGGEMVAASSTFPLSHFTNSAYRRIREHGVNAAARHSSFQLCFDLDSHGDLIGGLKIANQVTLAITKSGAGVAANVVMLTGTNSRLLISRSKARLIR